MKDVLPTEYWPSRRTKGLAWQRVCERVRACGAWVSSDTCARGPTCSHFATAPLRNIPQQSPALMQACAAAAQYLDVRVREGGGKEVVERVVFLERKDRAPVQRLQRCVHVFHPVLSVRLAHTRLTVLRIHFKWCGSSARNLLIPAISHALSWSEEGRSPPIGKRCKWCWCCPTTSAPSCGPDSVRVSMPVAARGLARSRNYDGMRRGRATNGIFSNVPQILESGGYWKTPSSY